MTMEELSKRITVLERSARRWRLTALTLALGVVGLAGVAQTGISQPDPDAPARPAARTPVSLAVVTDAAGKETLYRLWSDGAIERMRTPIFDFRGNDKWDLLRRP
jgi:hypothetical protein